MLRISVTAYVPVSHRCLSPCLNHVSRFLLIPPLGWLTFQIQHIQHTHNTTHGPRVSHLAAPLPLCPCTLLSKFSFLFLISVQSPFPQESLLDLSHWVRSFQFTLSVPCTLPLQHCFVLFCSRDVIVSLSRLLAPLVSTFVLFDSPQSHSKHLGQYSVYNNYLLSEQRIAA